MRQEWLCYFLYIKKCVDCLLCVQSVQMFMIPVVCANCSSAYNYIDILWFCGLSAIALPLFYAVNLEFILYESTVDAVWDATVDVSLKNLSHNRQSCSVTMKKMWWRRLRFSNLVLLTLGSLWDSYKVFKI